MRIGLLILNGVAASVGDDLNLVGNGGNNLTGEKKGREERENKFG